MRNTFNFICIKKAIILLIVFDSFIIGKLYSQHAESFSASPSLNVPTSTTKTSTISATVTHSPAQMSSSWGIYRVWVTITTPRSQYISLRLTSPTGVTRNLVTVPASPSTSYSNYKDTYFRDDAVMTLAALYAIPPGMTYRNNDCGAWIPEQSINGFNDGSNPNGTWTLTVINTSATFSATLVNWGFELRDTPGGDRNTSIWVTNSDAGYTAYDNCSAPKKMNKYYNYYGRTRLTNTCNTTTDPPKVICGSSGATWCEGSNNTNGTLDNTIWYSFMTDASGGPVNVLFTFINKYSAGGSDGYQVTVVGAATPCIAANWKQVTGSAYWGGNVSALGGASLGTYIIYNSEIICTGLTANTVYYICIDGNGNSLGTNCTGGTPNSDVDFQVEATGAVREDFSTLPVELNYFNASCESQKVNLKWSTYSETNNDYFTMERSSDLQNYTVIAKVSGAGNSNSILNYEYTDDAFSSEVNYYRLKQTDFNGEYEYFGPIAISCKSENDGQIKIFPNPAKDHIVISNLPERTTRIELTDLLGNVILSKAEITGNVVEIKPLIIPEGIYLLKIESDSQVVIKKVLIQ